MKETNNGLTLLLASHTNIIPSKWLVMQSILPNVGVEKESIEENSIYSLKPIEDMKLRGIQ